MLFASADLPYAPGDPQSYDAWSIGVVFLELILGTPHVFTISSRDRNILAHQVCMYTHIYMRGDAMRSCFLL